MGFADTLPDAALTGLERALNRFLRLDPAALQRLAMLDGKLIEIQVRSPDLRFYIAPGPMGMRLRIDAERTPDAIISGTPVNLVRNGLSRNPRERLLSGDVEISGDTDTGAALKTVIDEIDIDWEEQLSHLLGDIAAHQIGNLARELWQWSTESAEALQQDLGEYLQEESRLLPDRLAVESFMMAVDVLRADADRLEQRVERLLRACGEKNPDNDRLASKH